jgi:predicted unusual protein kinase regulating ubiquinone biosynthesis (AarF/ABC1/UbiB family)
MMGGVADEIKRGRTARNAKLASLPVGMAGRAALGLGKRLAGKSRDDVNAELMEKAAGQLFAVLGELKGGAMKVGQALSAIKAACVPRRRHAGDWRRRSSRAAAAST